MRYKIKFYQILIVTTNTFFQIQIRFLHFLLRLELDFIYL